MVSAFWREILQLMGLKEKEDVIFSDKARVLGLSSTSKVSCGLPKRWFLEAFYLLTNHQKPPVACLINMIALVESLLRDLSHTHETNDFPCLKDRPGPVLQGWTCIKALMMAGVKRIVFQAQNTFSSGKRQFSKQFIVITTYCRFVMHRWYVIQYNRIISCICTNPQLKVNFFTNSNPKNKHLKFIPLTWEEKREVSSPRKSKKRCFGPSRSRNFLILLQAIDGNERRGRGGEGVWCLAGTWGEGNDLQLWWLGAVRSYLAICTRQPLGAP